MNRWMLGGLLAVCCAGPATGETGDVSLSLRGEATHAFSADLDEDDAGEVSVSRLGGGVDVWWEPASRLRVILGLGTEVSWYDFDGARGGMFDDLFDTGVTHDLSVTGIYSVNDTISVLARGIVSSGYEPGGDFGESLIYGGGAAVVIRVSESLSLRVGGGVRTRLEDDPVFVPFVGVDWQISETTRLSVEGLTARLTTSVRDDLDVYLRATGEWREFRLDDGNDVLAGGAVSDLRVPVGVGLSWRPAKGLEIGIEGGAIVWQEYELRDDDDEVGDVNTDPSAYVALRVSWSF